MGIADRGGGELATSAGVLQVRIAEGFGVATFQLIAERGLLSVACLVWQPTDAEFAWRGLVRICGEMHVRPLQDAGGFPPAQPRLLPWLGVVLAPEFFAQRAADAVAKAEQIQWTMAWGLLEQHRTICRSN